MTLKKTFDGLTEEQKAKAKACKTAEELRALAEAEDFELTDEQLESISGGWAGKCDGYTCTSDTCDTYASKYGE